MAKRANWADEDDEGEGDDDNVEIGGSTVAKVGSAANPIPTTEEAGRTFMPPQKPRVHRERTIHGDFVVTKINVKTKEATLPEKTGDEDESEEEESSEEEEEPTREPEEEVKKGKQQFSVVATVT